MTNTKPLPRLRRAAHLSLALLGTASGGAQAVADDSRVNTELAQFQQRFSEDAAPTEVAPGVYAVFGPDYANYSVVEGSDGLIVIDSGWYPGTTRPIWQDIQKKLNKPVAALVYTHPHTDHFGGATAILEGAKQDVPIFGPEGWKELISYNTQNLYFMVYERVYEQMGILLPRGPEGTVGSGVGPSPRPDGNPVFIPPTVTIDKPMRLTIAGVDIEFIPSPGDIESNMLVWLPEKEVLFTGDVMGGIMPYIATPRFEPGRSPANYIKTLSRGLALSPKAVVPGHGRLLQGEEDVRDVMQSNIDLIRFLSDQVKRYAAKGYSADRIIDTLVLPPRLANHPDLQPHYHRLDWIIRGLTLKTAGFVGDVNDLSRLTDSEESRRMIALMGGRERVLAAIGEAIDDRDPRWAASLATRLLELDNNDRQARDLRLKAFADVAATTRSAPERNYLLTTIKEETSGIDWAEVLGPRAALIADKRTSGDLLEDMRYRYRAEDAGEQALEVAVQVTGEPGFYRVSASNAALVTSYTAEQPQLPLITLDRDTLIRLWARELSWNEAYDTKRVTVSDAPAAQLFDLIDD
ncbi:alkyl sulfatase dimerization domain-containing protein [Parahaliea mediterranea]|uniref:alkyl sulfatase dimerization domain-containing protein n=1 Tax=Parahaliea mediterranea TaxID=651086 RepID=UPI000E2EBBB8|nr:alkyl sulfatase dimerization domain-containing protein [Parahaliea mediterranea]